MVCLACLVTSSARAIVLDWNNFTWASGALTQSFDVDPNNPGNDITITVTGDTSWFVSGNTTTSPVVDNTLTGGQGTSQDSLLLGVNWPQNTRNLTITISFNYAGGVSDANFTLFDIDMSNGGSDSGWVDQITSIYATGTNGSLIAPSITGSTDNTVSGSGTNQVITGTATASQTSSDGNAYINFGSNYITSLTFTYGDDSSSPKNPGQQWIGIYDISFKPKVPEVHPALIASFCCFGGIGIRAVRLRFRRRVMKS